MITLTFTAGTLPPNFCPATWQLTFQAFVNALSATVNGLDNAQILVSSSTPAISTNYLWLQISGGGTPLQLYRASGGVWVPNQPTFFFPGLSDIGAANSYQVTSVTIPVSVNPDGTPATGLVAGMTFVFMAAHTNTAASTFQVNAYTQKPIVFGSVAITAGQISAGNWYIVIYDGTNFQLMNLSSVVPGTADGQIYTTRQTVVGPPSVFVTRWESRIYRTPADNLQAVPAGPGFVVFTHGLSVGGVATTPTSYGGFLICTDAGGDAGFVQNDVVPWPSTYDVRSAQAQYNSNYANSINITVMRIYTEGQFDTVSPTGTLVAIDPAKWKVGAFGII